MDPAPDESAATLRRAAEAAERFLAGLDREPGAPPGRDDAAERFAPGSLPEVGSGAAETIEELIAGGIPAATRSAGPRFFHFVTGGVMTAIIGVLMFPWKLYSDASAYIFTWLVGYSSLMGALGGILIADYWIIRRQQLSVPDLFREDGRYSYTNGVNIRAIVVLVISIAPVVPGFIHAATTPGGDSSPAPRLGPGSAPEASAGGSTDHQADVGRLSIRHRGPDPVSLGLGAGRSRRRGGGREPHRCRPQAAPAGMFGWEDVLGDDGLPPRTWGGGCGGSG